MRKAVFIIDHDEITKKLNEHRLERIKVNIRFEDEIAKMRKAHRNENAILSHKFFHELDLRLSELNALPTEYDKETWNLNVTDGCVFIESPDEIKDRLDETPSELKSILKDLMK